MTTNEELTLEEKVRILSVMTNRDSGGRHFTERYGDDLLVALEAEGLIEIHRPVHEPTGISYDHSCWHLEVTHEGVELVFAPGNEEYWDTSSQC